MNLVHINSPPNYACSCKFQHMKTLGITLYAAKYKVQIGKIGSIYLPKKLIPETEAPI